MIRTHFKHMAIALAVVGAVASVLPADTAGAATFNNNARDSSGKLCRSSFLGFPTWFNGLPRKAGTCNVAMSEKTERNQQGQLEEVTDGNSLRNFIFIIVLNVIEIGLRLVGFAAVGFIIYGGFKYLTSAGSADRITSGRKIILNAVIGLVISFFSVAIVNLIASGITV